ncbi:MAG TPA: GNAT family N-acetyltransferase [Candidatus Limnocylindrales bacterium]|nr:GNAT family N-acetyltransferase [Candidatus Limnocylindrales bacterium]
MLATLQTSRLLMRPYSREDIDGLHALWTAPDVRRYLWDDIVIPRETAEQAVAASIADVSAHRYGQWSLTLAQGGDGIIGFCGFRPWEDGAEPELLYGLARPYWGRGLAYEAARAALLYLVRTTRAPKVWAATDEPNVASQKVLDRLGMKQIESRPGPMWTQLRYELADPGRLLPFDAYATAD